MKLVHHITKHSRAFASHVKKHHKKYLAGFFGGFAVVKLFALVVGLSAVQYTITTHAQELDGCITTGQIYTGEYLTGQELSSGYLVDCVVTPGYWTGGEKDEFGETTGQIRIEETSTDCVVTGQELTGGYLTGGYRTSGITVCEETGTNDTGSNDTGVQLQALVTLGNGVCDSGDVVWNAVISGGIFRNIFPITWTYSGTDCLVSGMSLQLRDHNNQWISLATLASGITTLDFNSMVLVSSGVYTIPGTGLAYIYTGTYSGNYSRLFSGYKIRLLDSNQNAISETSLFTIDNQLPTLTGVTLFSSGSVTGYVVTSGVATLSFLASEGLSGVQVTLGSGKIATSSTISGLLYTYIRNMTSLYTEGPLVATISFADIAGNTGSLVYTSTLIFDITRPVITGFVFDEYASGLRLSFVGSEHMKYSFNYQVASGTLITGGNSEYLTAQQMILSGVEKNILYVFALDVFDRAGNARSVTGDFMWTTLGQVIFNIYAVPVVSEAIISGNLSSLAVVLKAEVEKFNACKAALVYTPVELEVRRNSFIIQMPNFKKSQMKTLVNAFTLFLLDKVKHDYKISKSDIEEITKKFDNFLVILKLMRDDDNDCKQNLSNYHIIQLQKSLQEYNINIQ